MLPPPLDPDTKISFDDSRNGGRTTRLNREDKSRASNVASTASSTSGVTQKAAPPVPKKPVLLSKLSGRRDLQSGIEVSRALAHRSTLVSHEKTIILPPPPRLNTGITPTSQSSPRSPAPQPIDSVRQQQGMLNNDDRRPLPPRSAAGDLSSSKDLMDEDDDGARTIPSLQPLRR